MVGEPRGAQGARLVGPSRCQGPVTLGQCLVNPMGVTMMQRHGNRLTVGIDNEDSQVQPLAFIVSNSMVMEVLKHWIRVKRVKLKGSE